MLQKFWYAIGHALNWCFDVFITPFGWWPVTIFILVLAFGAMYWINLQGKYNRRAKERGETI